MPSNLRPAVERSSSHFAAQVTNIEISVADNGEGISAELLPRIFERFLQGDAATNRRHGGLGLGLAIVRQLVEMHGGNVRAKAKARAKVRAL